MEKTFVLPIEDIGGAQILETDLDLSFVQSTVIEIPVHVFGCGGGGGGGGGAGQGGSAGGGGGGSHGTAITLLLPVQDGAGCKWQYRAVVGRGGAGGSADDHPTNHGLRGFDGENTRILCRKADSGEWNVIVSFGGGKGGAGGQQGPNGFGGDGGFGTLNGGRGGKGGNAAVGNTAGTQGEDGGGTHGVVVGLPPNALGIVPPLGITILNDERRLGGGEGGEGAALHANSAGGGGGGGGAGLGLGGRGAGGSTPAQKGGIGAGGGGGHGWANTKTNYHGADGGNGFLMVCFC